MATKRTPKTQPKAAKKISPKQTPKATKKSPKRETKATTAKLSQMAAALKVLQQAKEPLTCKQMVEAMAKKSDDRFASAAEFAHALQAVLDGRQEIPPFGNGAAAAPARQMMASQPAGAVGTPAQQAPTVPHPPRSTPLPKVKAPPKPSIALLVGVAAAFLVVGAVLAAIIMKLVLK